MGTVVGTFGIISLRRLDVPAESERGGYDCILTFSRSYLFRRFSIRYPNIYVRIIMTRDRFSRKLLSVSITFIRERIARCGVGGRGEGRGTKEAIIRFYLTRSVKRYRYLNSFEKEGNKV